MPKNVLTAAAEKINALPEEQRPAFARALHASLRCDRENPKATPSPKQLEAEFGIPIEALVERGICLQKEDAYHFLQYAGRGIAIAKLRRKFSADYYRSVLGRKVSKKGMRALVFTYGEILCMARYFAFQASFPESLQAHIPAEAATETVAAATSEEPVAAESPEPVAETAEPEEVPAS